MYYVHTKPILSFILSYYHSYDKIISAAFVRKEKEPLSQLLFFSPYFTFTFKIFDHLLKIFSPFSCL